MTDELELWLRQATKKLSRESAAQVKSEILEHYESAREAAMTGGATAAEAERQALQALGDARRTNCEYRKVLLTSAEAGLLRQGKWEARMVCSNRLVRSLVFAVPVLAFLGAAALFRAGSTGVARTLFVASAAMSFLFIVPLLPVYTPSRSRILRYVKWIVIAGMPVLALGNEAAKFSWLLIASLWPVFWVEWTRVAIRRKLPVAEWPKHLYL